MKKGSGKRGSKPSTIDSVSFVGQLNESQQLQDRLRAIVHELKATVETLEQNLQEARTSAQSQRKAKAASDRKTSESIIGEELENRKGNEDREIAPWHKKAARS